MPIYEYICKDCGAHLDALRPMKDADKPLICKDCLGDHTVRQLSVFNAKSGGQAIAGTSSCNCGSCSGGSCGSCHN